MKNDNGSKIFRIRFKRGGSDDIRAFDYTEDEENQRYLFHKNEDRSDRKNFILFDMVGAIYQIEAAEPFVPLDEIMARVDEVEARSQGTNPAA
jgi:hypothetical protein